MTNEHYRKKLAAKNKKIKMLQASLMLNTALLAKQCNRAMGLETELGLSIRTIGALKAELAKTKAECGNEFNAVIIAKDEADEQKAKAETMAKVLQRLQQAHESGHAMGFELCEICTLIREALNSCGLEATK